MDSIDTLLAARVNKPSGIVSGEVPVWNGTGWARSSVTKIGNSSLPEWQSYTPTWASAGTPPALGNGTIVGRYIQIGKFISVQVKLTLGTTSTVGTGQYFISMPVTAAAAVSLGIGNGYIYDSSAASLWTIVVQPASTTQAGFYFTGAGGAHVVGGAAAPFGWAVNDEINASFVIEAA